MDAWWYFEEGRAPEPIRGVISHLKRKHVCLLFYERCVIRGRTAKRKAQVAFGKDTREVKRNCPQIIVPTGVQPPVSGRHGEWSFPKRTLKKYPSFVQGLKLLELQEDRLVACAHSLVSDFFSLYPDSKNHNQLLEFLHEGLEQEFETANGEDCSKLWACMVVSLQKRQLATNVPRQGSLCAEAIASFLPSVENAFGDHPSAASIFLRMTGLSIAATSGSGVELRAIEGVSGSVAASIPVVSFDRLWDGCDVVDLTCDEDRVVVPLPEEPALPTSSVTEIPPALPTSSVTEIPDEPGESVASRPGSHAVCDEASQLSGVILRAAVDASCAEVAQPSRRMRRSAVSTTEAVPVRRSTRIASRSSQADGSRGRGAPAQNLD
jgi:hypothetical protein